MSPILKVKREIGPIRTEVLSKVPARLKSLYLRNHWELAAQISHGAGPWPLRSFKKVFLWKPEVCVGHIWLGRCIGGSNLRPSGPRIAILTSGRRKVIVRTISLICPLRCPSLHHFATSSRKCCSQRRRWIIFEKSLDYLKTFPDLHHNSVNVYGSTSSTAKQYWSYL